MEKSTIFAAVDIGTNKTVCLIGRDNGDNKMEVIGHAVSESAGVRRGVLLNIDETSEVVLKTVSKASENLDVEIKNLYVNIAGQYFRSIERKIEREIQHGKIVSKNDIKELSLEARDIELYPGEKIYHLVTQSYSIDNEEIYNPIGVAGERLVARYMLIVGPEIYQQKIAKSLQLAGLNLVKCVVNPVASAESVLTDDEKEGGVVVVDLGGGTSSVSVFFEGSLRHMAVIPFGGNVVTNDIKEGCSILLRQAESLKVQFGMALGDFAPENKVITIPGINGWEPKEISCKTLAYIIQARMEEIIESIAFQIERSGYADRLGAGIVLTGGGATLEGLNQLIRFKTGLDVRLGYPIVKLNLQQEKILDNPRFATVFGLLQKAMGDEKASNEEVAVVKPVKKKEKSGLRFSESVINKLTLFFNDDQEV